MGTLDIASSVLGHSEDCIELLHWYTTSLWYEEPDVYGTENDAASKEEEGTEADRGDHIRGGLADYEVEEPLRGSTKRGRDGSYVEGNAFR